MEKSGAETAPSTDPQSEIAEILLGIKEPNSLWTLQLKLVMEKFLDGRPVADFIAQTEEQRQDDENEAMKRWIEEGRATAFRELVRKWEKENPNSTTLPKITLEQIL